ncbi:hypothetical protein ACE60T_005816, partial [Salmonella enterica]
MFSILLPSMVSRLLLVTTLPSSKFVTPAPAPAELNVTLTRSVRLPSSVVFVRLKPFPVLLLPV